VFDFFKYDVQKSENLDRTNKLVFIAVTNNIPLLLELAMVTKLQFRDHSRCIVMWKFAYKSCQITVQKVEKIYNPLTLQAAAAPGKTRKNLEADKIIFFYPRAKL
jgi:hypothetical protein